MPLLAREGFWRVPLVWSPDTSTTVCKFDARPRSHLQTGMVPFFETSMGHVIYVDADKYENEDLMKYGLPTDYWFHVEDMSSAHVYL